MLTKRHFPTRPYAAIIFDCDGTLTDSMPVHFRAWQRTMSKYGIAFTEARFYEMAGVPTDRIIAQLIHEQQLAIDSLPPVLDMALEKESNFLELLHHLEPIDVVIEVAAHFRGRIPLAVASGGFRAVIDKQLAQIGCGDWFTAIVSAEDTQRHKPFPDVFLEAARQLDVKPQDCLVYEDADLGLAAAHAAGMDAIDVRHHFQSKQF